MGMLIELSNRHRSYFPGQAVEGRLIVENAKPDKVKEVTISLKGRGRVRWIGGASYSVDKRTRIRNGQPQVETFSIQTAKSRNYHAEESYLSYLMTLAGDGETSIIIPEGTNSYPFRFILPLNLPSSFRNDVGQIYYFLKGSIRRSLLVSDDHTRLPITVNGILDLNLEEWASQPQNYRGRMGSNRCFCRTGHLSFDLSLPTRSGFVPREKIDFRVLMENRSNRRVTGVVASLQQIVKFYAKGQTKVLKRRMAEVKGPALEEGECEVWEGNLIIPGVPPTKLGGICQIMDVYYCLEFEMKISGLSYPLIGRLHVMIGTIPLRATFGNFLRASSTYSRSGLSSSANSNSYSPSHGPSHGIGASSSHSVANRSRLRQSVCSNPPGYTEVVPSAPIFANYPDLPPPSYGEALVAEGFKNWESAEMENDGQVLSLDGEQGSSSSHNSSNSPPSAQSSSFGGFVPVYVTYATLV